METLWKEIEQPHSDEELFSKLKLILKQLDAERSCNNIDGVCRPTILTNIARILQDQHNSAVYAVTIAILATVSTSRQIQLFLRKKHIFEPVVQFFIRKHLNFGPTCYDGQMQCLLYRDLSSLISFLSGLSINIKDALLEQQIVSKLINFLCPFSPIFCYDNKAKDALKIVLRLPLSGRVEEITAEPSLKTLKTVRETYLRMGDLDISQFMISTDFYDLDLLDTTSKPNSKVVDNIIEAGLVWRKRESNQSVGKTRENESDYVNVTVVAIINPEYVWANIGADSPQLCLDVQKSISSVPETSRDYFTRPPLPKIVVCGSHNTRGCFRAQVISSDDTQSRVFAFDYGVVIKVSWEELFSPTPEMQLGRIKPQATLCRLKGICPKPVNTDLVVYCLDALVNLSSYQPAVSQFYPAADSNYNNLYFLIRLLYCATDVRIQLKTVRTLCNLCHYTDSLKMTLVDLDIIPITLDLLRSASREMHKDNTRHGLIISAIMLLSNLVLDCSYNKEMLQDEGGLELLLKLCMNNVPVQIRSVAMRAVKVYLCTGKPVNNHQQARDGRQPHTRQPSRGGQRDSAQRNDRATTHQRSIGSGSDRKFRKESQLSSVSPLYSDEAILAFEKSLPGSEFQVRHGSSHTVNTRMARPNTVVNKDGTFLSERGNYMRALAKQDIQDNDEINATNDEDEKKNVNIRLVNTADVYNKENEKIYYVRDSTVAFKADDKHEFDSTSNVKQLSADNMAARICGFLNGHGGAIYIGINKMAESVGVRVNHGERDVFRLAINRITTNFIQPLIKPDQVLVEFIPVIRRVHSDNVTLRQAVPDLYVIEVHVTCDRSFSTVYIAKPGGFPFIRKNDQTIQATFQDIRELAVTRTERDSELEISLLQEDIIVMKQVIARCKSRGEVYSALSNVNITSSSHSSITSSPHSHMTSPANCRSSVSTV